MELITKLWFAEGRIYILTDKGNTYSRPLEAFPLLLEATPEQRQRFVIGLDGEDIRWEEIDEDIHISSFYNTEEPNPDNVIADPVTSTESKSHPSSARTRFLRLSASWGARCRRFEG